MILQSLKDPDQRGECESSMTVKSNPLLSSMLLCYSFNTSGVGKGNNTHWLQESLILGLFHDKVCFLLFSF